MQIISLSIAGLLASSVYIVSNKLLVEKPQPSLENITYAVEKAPTPTGLETINKTVMPTLAKASPMPYILAVLVFVVSFFLVFRYLLSKRI